VGDVLLLDESDVGVQARAIGSIQSVPWFM
jgi:hypothetical protein